MPTKAQHIQKAEHNEQFSNSLIATVYTDWAVTGYFYSALHYVDAYLSTKGIHPIMHTQRDNKAKRALPIKIWGAYRYLKDASRDTRYDMKSFNEPEINSDILPEFEKVKNHINDVMT
jgi:uncharacterized protein (UPF0332 family)